jgi:hypothetical protein
LELAALELLQLKRKINNAATNQRAFRYDYY